MNPDNGASFVEANKDFVLKLNFTGEGDVSQVRRIRLPRIVDANGSVSYDELCGLAISLVIPENVEDPSSVGVRLTYKDEDDDLITIGSTPELLDAVEQFVEQKVLRVTAEIKRCKTTARSTFVVTAPPVAASRSSTVTSTASTEDKGDQTGRSKHAVLQHVVESIVNVVLNAAVAVNGHAPHPDTVFDTPDGMPAAAAASPTASTTTSSTEETPKAAAAVKPTVDEAVVEDKKEGVAASKAEKTKESTQDEKPKAKAAPVVVSKEKEAPKDAAPNGPAAEERPFIHGRHTCDSCLGTPIIGVRYHAKNLPDYDLCQNCFGKYQGAEIEFEPVELDRDRNFQDRWHRRRERTDQRRGRGGRRHRWGPHPPCPPGPPPPCPPPHHHGHHPPPPPCPPGPPPPPGPWHHHHHHGPPPPFPPPHHHGHHPSPPPCPPGPPSPPGPWHHHHGPPPCPPFPPPPPGPWHHVHYGPPCQPFRSPSPHKAALDLALEEAIRESLRDLKKEEPKDAAKSAPEPSAPVEEKAVQKVEGDEEVAKVEDEKPKSVPVEVSVTVTDDGLPAAPEDEHADAASKKSETNTSFASDAIGSGEIADMLGETLDKCAEAINDLQAELDRSTYSCPDGTDVDDDDVEDEVVVETVESDDDGVCEVEDSPAAEEGEVTDGATIIEPDDSPRNEEPRAEERSEDDGWQVVSEEQQQIQGDEELARAAQMVGSALFHSDMRSSGEVLSTLGGSAASSSSSESSASSDTFSFASSVPTTLPSISGASARGNVTEEQRARWSTQLDQLHEMGFDKDSLCVEILEKFTAANIGSGLDDEEISVSRVVNELWKN